MMLAPARSKRPQRQQIARTKSLPAPTGGWNARDALPEMDPKDAVILDNFFCTPTEVELRSGYSNHVTGISGTVESLMPYNPIDSTNKMFGAAGGSIYDVTSAGAVGAAVQSGLSNARWQHINFNATGTEVLYIVNGADQERWWDGSSWNNATLTGLTAGDAININVHQQRIWFVIKNSLKAAYLPTASLQGTVSIFDLGQIFVRGGTLKACATWTLDAGYGLEDLLAFITSEGEVAVYRGTDPSSASTWQLVGRFYVGAPLGNRCFARLGGDMLLICKDGLMPFAKALMSSRVSTKISLTDKIQSAISQYTSQYSANFGWEIRLFPQENALILNVPIGGGLAYQAVMNTITGSWSRFVGWNASCFQLFNDLLYFGTSTKVVRAWNTNADNSTNINAEALQAFNDFGSDTQLKMFRMVRPIISTNGTPGLNLGVNVDFDQTAPVGVPSFSGTTAATWGSGVWGTSVWGSSGELKRNWQSANKLGYWAALHLKSASAGITLRWASTDYVYEPGGVV